MTETAFAPTIRLKSVALPVEHGGWAFLYEPILLGLLLAPSFTGLWLGISAFGVFLLYQPLKMAIKDHLKHKRYPRTIWAERFVLLYALTAAIGLALAWMSTGTPFWLPILLALPFAGVQIGSGINNQSRSVTSEIAGAIALSGVAPAIVIAGGWSIPQALMLWVIPIIRAVVSILYIRARLRLERGENINAWLVTTAHTLGLLILIGLWVAKLLPSLVVIAGGLLWLRAVAGLSALRRARQAKTLGFLEMGFGLFVIVMTVIGYRLIP